MHTKLARFALITMSRYRNSRSHLVDDSVSFKMTCSRSMLAASISEEALQATCSSFIDHDLAHRQSRIKQFLGHANFDAAEHTVRKSVQEEPENCLRPFSRTFLQVLSIKILGPSKAGQSFECSPIGLLQYVRPSKGFIHT